MNLRTLAAVVLALALVGTGIGAAAPGLGKYQDADRALADGYVGTEHCVPGMGFHFVNPALVDSDVKTSEPEVLVYAYNDDDELELVAVEYVSTEEYEILGKQAQYSPPARGYAVHAWYFLPNPDGLTEDFNSRVDGTCHIN